jgi:molybdenum cofactor biosynthesis enzyme MoaA
MLKAYIRRLKDKCTVSIGNALSAWTPPREWLDSAFYDLIALDGNREAMLGSIAGHTRKVAAGLKVWLNVGDSDSGRALAESLLTTCSAIDNGKVWHREPRFRSYVDISVQVKTLRIFVDYLSSLSESTPALGPLELTSLVLEHFPGSRVGLLAHAELLMDDGDADRAMEAIERALRIQAVCTLAQQMLFRAYRIQREQGSTSPALDVLDYDLRDKFCHLPFTHLSTGFQGSVFACSCPAWVPFSIGNILEAPSADAIWNSDVAVEIRRSVLDGDYSYCSRTQCSFITAQKLPRKSEITSPKLRAYIDNHTTRISDVPVMVELNHDPTCNLACPSCRTEIVAATSDEVDLYAEASERAILPLLRKVVGHTYITGGGEAFASKHFRSILRALNRDEYPGLSVYLITNGQLMTPHRWSEFPNLPEMLAIVSVSVDAACAETYEKLRRPGKWTPLMKNLDFLAEMRRTNRIPRLGLNFVVQKDNFREILDFVSLADGLGTDQIWFQRVVNYGAYDEATFAEVNVTAPTHPNHSELLEILRNPVLRRPTINMQMLLSLLPEAVASDERIESLY